MAATKILTHLLRQDNIAYKIRPVATLSHLRDAAAEFGVLGIKTVFMINCGAVRYVSSAGCEMLECNIYPTVFPLVHAM
jgi:hypothetical protein